MRPGHPGHDPQAWPAHLRSAVQTFGGDVVHQAGLAVLGYPPAWTLSTSEIQSKHFGKQLIALTRSKT